MISQQGTPKNNTEASLREADPVIVNYREKVRCPLMIQKSEEKMQWEDSAITSNLQLLATIID